LNDFASTGRVTELVENAKSFERSSIKRMKTVEGKRGNSTFLNQKMDKVKRPAFESTDCDHHHQAADALDEMIGHDAIPEQPYRNPLLRLAHHPKKRAEVLILRKKYSRDHSHDSGNGRQHTLSTLPVPCHSLGLKNGTGGIKVECPLCSF